MFEVKKFQNILKLNPEIFWLFGLNYEKEASQKYQKIYSQRKSPDSPGGF